MSLMLVTRGLLCFFGDVMSSWYLMFCFCFPFCSSSHLLSLPLVILVDKMSSVSSAGDSETFWNLLLICHHGYLGHEHLLCSSVYSCHLFLISSASVRSIPFLSFIVPIFAWSVPSVSLIFLKRSLVFPILLFSSISLHWSLISRWGIDGELINKWGNNGNSNRVYFLGLQNHCRWWLQPWN